MKRSSETLDLAEIKSKLITFNKSLRQELKGDALTSILTECNSILEILEQEDYSPEIGAVISYTTYNIGQIHFRQRDFGLAYEVSLNALNQATKAQGLLPNDMYAKFTISACYSLLGNVCINLPEHRNESVGYVKQALEACKELYNSNTTFEMYQEVLRKAYYQLFNIYKTLKEDAKAKDVARDRLQFEKDLLAKAPDNIEQNKRAFEVCIHLSRTEDAKKVYHHVVALMKQKQAATYEFVIWKDMITPLINNLIRDNATIQDLESVTELANEIIDRNKKLIKALPELDFALQLQIILSNTQVFLSLINQKRITTALRYKEEIATKLKSLTEGLSHESYQDKYPKLKEAVILQYIHFTSKIERMAKLDSPSEEDFSNDAIKKRGEVYTKLYDACEILKDAVKLGNTNTALDSYIVYFYQRALKVLQSSYNMFQYPEICMSSLKYLDSILPPNQDITRGIVRDLEDWLKTQSKILSRMTVQPDIMPEQNEDIKAMYRSIITDAYIKLLEWDVQHNYLYTNSKFSSLIHFIAENPKSLYVLGDKLAKIENLRVLPLMPQLDGYFMLWHSFEFIEALFNSNRFLTTINVQIEHAYAETIEFMNDYLTKCKIQSLIINATLWSEPETLQDFIKTADRHPTIKVVSLIALSYTTQLNSDGTINTTSITDDTFKKLCSSSKKFLFITTVDNYKYYANQSGETCLSNFHKLNLEMLKMKDKDVYGMIDSLPHDEILAIYSSSTGGFTSLCQSLIIGSSPENFVAPGLVESTILSWANERAPLKLLLCHHHSSQDSLFWALPVELLDVILRAMEIETLVAIAKA